MQERVLELVVRPAMLTAVGELTDQAWTEVEPLVGEGSRKVVDGLLWFMRTGGPWEDLPALYGNPAVAAARLAAWRTDGTWTRIEAAIGRGAILAGELTHQAWMHVKPLVGKLTREGLDAVLWYVRTGGPWTGMPTHYGNYHRASARLAAWKKDGHWTRIEAAIGRSVIEAVLEPLDRPRMLTAAGELTDPAWIQVEPLVGDTSRNVVDAVLWLVRTGEASTRMPAHHGEWKHASDRLVAWRSDGTWTQIEVAIGRGAILAGGLTGQAWIHVKPLVDNTSREMVDGLLWFMRTGGPWEELPALYGNPAVASARLAAWRTDGTWTRIEAAIGRGEIEAGDLTDQAWIHVKPLVDNTSREMVDGLLWFMRTGGPWSRMPKHYGNRTTASNLFATWNRGGKWTEILTVLRGVGVAGQVRESVLGDGAPGVDDGAYAWFELDDPAWARIEPLLPSSSGLLDARAVVEGIRWKYGTGRAWSEVPSRYGDAAAIEAHAREWRMLDGLWRAIGAEDLAADHTVAMSADVLSPGAGGGRELEQQFEEIGVDVVEPGAAGGGASTVRPAMLTAVGDLTDQGWDRVKRLVGMTSQKGVEAVLWYVRTGGPWEEMPEHYGNHEVASTRFDRWRQDGTWTIIEATLGLGAVQVGVTGKVASRVRDLEALGRPGMPAATSELTAQSGESQSPLDPVVSPGREEPQGMEVDSVASVVGAVQGLVDSPAGQLDVSADEPENLVDVVVSPWREEPVQGMEEASERGFGQVDATGDLTVRVSGTGDAIEGLAGERQSPLVPHQATFALS